MNLQFLSGNPRSSKSRKKLAKKKKGSTLKVMRKSKTKKNPVTITRERDGKKKVIGQFLTKGEYATVQKASHKQAKKLGPKKGKKMMSLLAKRIAKEHSREQRAAGYDEKVKRLNEIRAKDGRPKITVSQSKKEDNAWALKKMRLGKYQKGKSSLSKSKIEKLKKREKAAEKKKLRERVLKNLGLSKKANSSSKFSAVVAKIKKKKEKSVAKRKKKKASKKRAKKVSKKRSSKKASKKRSSKRRSSKKASKKRVSKRRFKKSAKRRSSKRKKSVRRKSRRKLIKAKSVTVYRTRKSGKRLKTKRIKRTRGGKLSAFIKNPIGGAMKALDKVNKYSEMALGHSVQEAGTLFAAGSLVGSIEGLVVKGIQKLNLPIPVSMQKYVPTVATLAAAGAAHYFAEKKLGSKHVATQMAKAVIAASIVKAGDQFVGGYVKEAVGMSGVIATMGYHSNADFGTIPQLVRPMGEIPKIVPGIGYHSNADFGRMGEIPRVVPGMGGVIATPGMNGVLAVQDNSMGYHSNADFGALDMTDSENGDYEDSDQESMAGLS